MPTAARPSSVRAQIRSLAAAQAGVVTREQARAYGLSDGMIARLVREAHWRRLDRGLFLTADIDPCFEARAWAGVLLGGDHARIGGLAAGRLNGLVDDDPEVMVVLVPHACRVMSRPGWQVVLERPGTHRAPSRGAPPRIDVDDTVLDLCAAGTPAGCADWVTIAVQRRLTTPRRLLRALEARERHPQRRTLRKLLEEVAQGAQSPLELTYLRDVERAHDLPCGVRQAVSADRSAVRDVLYAEYGVVVELDGRLGHTELGRFRDLSRDNAATLEGLCTLRYGHAEVHARPCAVAEQVAAALAQRGWTGILRRCERCRRVA